MYVGDQDIETIYRRLCRLFPTGSDPGHQGRQARLSDLGVARQHRRRLDTLR